MLVIVLGVRNNPGSKGTSFLVLNAYTPATDISNK